MLENSNYTVKMKKKSLHQTGERAFYKVEGGLYKGDSSEPIYKDTFTVEFYSDVVTVKGKKSKVLIVDLVPEARPKTPEDVVALTKDEDILFITENFISEALYRGARKALTNKSDRFYPIMRKS